MAKGKVVQVIGTVVDVAFQQGQMPAIYNALEIETGAGKIVLEVQDHLGNDWVRCLSLSPTHQFHQFTTILCLFVSSIEQ